MNVEVLRAGLQSTVQDTGRPGYQRFGVVVGGAADPFAARVLNRLVGNDPGLAVLEMALTGPKLRFSDETLIAWGGADFEATCEGAPLPKNRPVLVKAGAEVDFTAARHGTTAWLAVAGGIAVPMVMGSRSTYLAAGLGGLDGRTLAVGDVLPLGPASEWAGAMAGLLKKSGKPAGWAVPPDRLGFAMPRGILRVVRGPEWSWFSKEAHGRFARPLYQVTKDSNRMGLRLNGEPLRLTEPRELASAAVNHGLIQVPPSGQPIILGADRQTLGGYPRIGAVVSVDFGALAQLRPGDPVCFQEIPMAEAHALLERRERHLAMATIHLSTPRA